MPFFLHICKTFVTIISFLSLFCAFDLHAAMDPRFELDPLAIPGLKSTPKPQQAGNKNTSGTAKKAYSKHPKAVNARVKSRAADSLASRQTKGVGKPRNYDSDTTPGQSFKLDSPLPALSGQEVVERTQGLWSMIVPSKNEQHQALSLQTPTFSLTLDQARYPVFARMKGGRIILDPNGSIPPLVKSLIENKDASVRIVTEAPDGSKKYLSSLLEAAGFYSVEENFTLEFGADPKVKVHADFKVEKNADSLINQDVVIISNGRNSFPSSLGNFLKKEGFSLYEPFASLTPLMPHEAHRIHYVSEKKQPEIVDSVLSALLVAPEKNKQVDVFAAADNGISLAVNAERYFIHGGRRYVVTTFNGDPVSYTLFRILETTGFRVVILRAEDDFRKVSEKILSSMRIKGSFAQHNLLQEDSSGYSLQMSGFKLDDAQIPGGLFLTDRAMNPLVRDIFRENGYSINNR